jgi:hypothetical protein
MAMFHVPIYERPRSSMYIFDTFFSTKHKKECPQLYRGLNTSDDEVKYVSI